MPVLRKSTLNQLKRINSEIKKQGGKTDRTSDSEKGLFNSVWTHDPIDADKLGKRKIATYEDMYSIDIPDSPTKVKKKYEKISYYDKNWVWFSSSDGFDLEGHKKRFGNDITFSVDGITGQFNNIEDYKKAVKMNKTVFSSKSLDELEKERNDAKKRVMIKRKNITTNENIVKINGFEYFYDNIKNKLYSDKTKTNEIDVYKQLTKNERDQLQNCIKNKKNENMKLNEGKVKQTLQDAIDEYYLEDNGDAVDIISQLTGLNFDQVITTLDISSQENAMKNLMEQNYTKNERTNMKYVKRFEQMFEKTENVVGSSVTDINRDIPKINNWFQVDHPVKERDILIAGNFIEFDDFKGYINRIVGKFIYIEDLDKPGEITKFKLVDVLKKLKPKKDDKKEVLDFSLVGPNNKSLGSSPKEESGNEPKIDGVAKNVEKKLSDKIYKVKKISDSINTNEQK
jgi:hypothetical protein